MPVRLTASDTAPIRLTYKNNGVPVDITGYGFTLKIGYATPTVLQAVITDAANGVFEFRPGASDLVANTVPIEIMVTFPDGKEKTQKLGSAEIMARIA